MEYIRNNLDFIKHYEGIVKLEELKDYKPYQLALYRYAYKMMEENIYEIASQVFLYCCDEKIQCMVAAYERGKACYYVII